MSFIVALFTDTSTELMSGAKSQEWVHHNSTNQPTNQLVDLKLRLHQPVKNPISDNSNILWNSPSLGINSRYRLP